MAVMENDTDTIPTAVQKHGAARILVVNDDSHLYDIKGHIHELITEAWSQHVSTIAIPVGCLPQEFFQLRSGVAVAMSQKLANYRITVAFVGDIDRMAHDSDSFAAFIRDCNRGRSIWFVNDMNSLGQRLAIRAS
jgi:hypothetical protein